MQSPQSLTLKNSEVVALHLWADVRGLGFYTPTPTRYLMLSALESGHGFGCAKVIPKEGWLAVECCLPTGPSEAQGGRGNKSFNPIGESGWHIIASTTDGLLFSLVAP